MHYAPALLGVINLSPESMVRDSIVRDATERDERAAQLRQSGASLLDLGGRSITPDAAPIDDGEEQRRLEPAVRALVEQGYRVSVDSWSSETAVLALRWGARFLNYTGEDLPDELLEETAGAPGAQLALSYMPYGNAYQMRDTERAPYHIDRIVDFFGPRVERARRAGLDIAGGQLVLDPNLGILHPATDDYTKIQLQHHVLWNLEALRVLGCPVMLYAARKPERLARIMMASAVLHARPEYIRTHEPQILQRLLQASRETSA